MRDGEVGVYERNDKGRCLLSQPECSVVRGPLKVSDDYKEFAGIFLLPTHIFILLTYDRWEDATASKILVQGVGVICQPDKHHSENFQKSPQIEK